MKELVEHDTNFPFKQVPKSFVKGEVKVIRTRTLVPIRL